MAFHVTPSSTNVAFEPLRQQVQTLLIVRLVPGNEKNTCRHLQQLYHKQLINRFAFVQGKNFTEFYYYDGMRFGAIEKSATVMPLIRNAPPTCKDSLPS
jgi:hypothetical protein